MRCCLYVVRALGADQNVTKVQVAEEVVQGVLDKLAPGDRLAIVLFARSAAASLRSLACSDGC